MASSSIAASVDGLLLVPMPAPATPRKSAATWVEAMCLNAHLLLLPRLTRTKPNTIMPRLSPLFRTVRSLLRWKRRLSRGNMQPDCASKRTLSEAILFNDLFSNLDAKSRRQWDINPAVFLRERCRHQFMLHRVFQWLHFKQQAAVGKRGERQASCCDDGAAPGVGIVPGIGLLYQLDQLVKAGDSLCSSRVAPHNIHDTRFDQSLIAFEVPFSLAGGDEGLHVLAQFAESLDIGRLQWLLDPAQVIFLESIDQRDGMSNVPLQRLAPVNHDIRFWPHRFAQQAHERNVALGFVAQVRCSAFAEANFHAPVALLAHVSPVTLSFLLNAWKKGMSAGNDRQAFTIGPTKQLDKWQTEQFPFQVPQCDVYSAERKRSNATLIAVPPHMRLESPPVIDVIERVAINE